MDAAFPAAFACLSPAAVSWAYIRMLVSTKYLALMELVAVEPPAAGPPAGLPREMPELGHVPLGVVAAGQALEILANELVEALPHGVGLPAGFDMERLESLGLTIVKTLVEGDLGGSFSIGSGAAGACGTHARLSLPKAQPNPTA